MPPRRRKQSVTHSIND